jgi:Tfp pilus assembly protein PilO
MRSLTYSEIFLLGLCFFSVFFVGHLIAYKQYSLKVKKAEQVLVDLGTRGDSPRLEEAKSTPAAQSKIWEDRMKWLDDELPTMPSRDQAQAALLEDMRQSAKKYALDVDGLSFVKPAKTPHYQEVAVKINLDGPERKVYQWLSEIQSPSTFQAIKFLRVRPEGRRSRPDGDCEIIIARLFKP